MSDEGAVLDCPAPLDDEWRVLVADHRFLAGDTTQLGRLTASGLTVVSNPHGRRLSTQELLALGSDCLGVIAGSEHYSDDVLAQLPRLRCISRIGVGTDNIDLDAARRRGVTVCTTPDAPTQAVAEFTVGVMLALVRGIPRMDRAVHAGGWDPHLGRQLDSLRVGLIGLGRIGRAVTGLLRGWGCNVTGCDIAPVETWAQAAGVRLMPLEDLLPTADLVSLHLPHTPATHHLINTRTIGLMKPGALLVNTSRGGLIDEDALHAALVGGRLGGAALDVFAEEPYRGPLASLDGVLLTAHAASHTAEARRRMEREAVENLLDVLLSRQGELRGQGK